MTSLVIVDFYGDTLFALQTEDGPFVAAKPIVDRFGLSWQAQLERIKRDTVLAEGIRMTRIPSPGGEQEMVCLPLKLIPGWLFGIDERRVKEEMRERVLLYKRRAYEVLAERFLGKHAEHSEVELLSSDLPAKPFHLWTTAEINAQCRVADLYGNTRGPEAQFGYMMYAGFPPLAVLFGNRPIPGQMILPGVG